MKVTIYLGSRCNLNCAYCHRDVTEDVQVSQDFLESLKDEDDLVIKFMGGEPLLYMDTIKRFIEELPQAKFVVTTNGTLLDEHIEYFRKHKVYVCLSYDGAGTKMRGFAPFTKVIDYPWLQVSCVLYHGNTDLKKIYDDFAEKEDVIGRPLSFCPHIMHVTNETNKKFALTKEDYDLIISQYKLMLEEFYQHVALMGVPLRRYLGLYSFFYRGMTAGYEYGETYCVNGRSLKTDVAGKLYSCHYIRDHEVRDGKDLAGVLDEFGCNKCRVYPMCGGACVKSIEHHLECYFYKTMYSWFVGWYEERRNVLDGILTTKPYDNSDRPAIARVYGFSGTKFSDTISGMKVEVEDRLLKVSYMFDGTMFQSELDLGLVKRGTTAIIVRDKHSGKSEAIYDYHGRIEEMGLTPSEFCGAYDKVSVVQVYSISGDRFYLKCVGPFDMRVCVDGRHRKINWSDFNNLEAVDGQHSFRVFPHELDVQDGIITSLWRVMISSDYPKKLYINYNGEAKRVREGLVQVSFPYKEGECFYWGDEGTRYKGRSFSIEQEV